MLQLKHITKSYGIGQAETAAISAVSISFRQREFVSILGPSGCGKTSLLNIMGGLDCQTSGELLIDTISASSFTDADWDSHRNNNIGFIFQSYNLIPHQTIFKNVELALRLTGESKSERHRQVMEALTRVGLSDYADRFPAQLSGGQQQRVAIARALINRPQVILADEPTGALDNENSASIMEILNAISKDCLVIVVTHNAELAKKYSSRILQMEDGKIIADSDPFDCIDAIPLSADSPNKPQKSKKRKTKRRAMPLLSALQLSFSNLLTKKVRTALITLAGSVGIIGIALILSIATAVNLYIADVERDTLLANPLTVQQQNQDFSTILSSMLTTPIIKDEDSYDSNLIYINDKMSNTLHTGGNDLRAFYQYLKEHETELAPYLNAIGVTYDPELAVFSSDGTFQVNPSSIFETVDTALDDVSDLLSSISNVSLSVLSELIDNREILEQQYTIVGDVGHWPNSPDEVVLVVDKNNELTKLSLYMLGLISYEDATSDKILEPYALNSLVGTEFKLISQSDFFIKSAHTYEHNDTTYQVWQDIRDGVFDQESFVKEHGLTIKVSAVVKPRATTTASSITGLIGYTNDLVQLLIKSANSSAIVQQQLATPSHSVLTGVEFQRKTYDKDTIHELINKVDRKVMSQVYEYIENSIAADPEFAELFSVYDTSTFVSFFGLLPRYEQQALLEAVLIGASAVTENISKIDLLVGALPYPELKLTSYNLAAALPILNSDEVSYLFLGTDEIPGLLAMCGEAFCGTLYNDCTDQLVNMAVTEESFLLFMQSGFITDSYFKTVEDMLYQLAQDDDASLEHVLAAVGYADFDAPKAISFYAKDFRSREVVEDFIAQYSADTGKAIKYTDVTKSVLNIIHSVILVVSCVLVAFVAISLLVSSLMIGVITYVSVLERKKEIGILRALGASKADIRHIFNAETIIIGFASGCIGVGISVIINIIINALLLSATNIPNIHAELSPLYAVALIGISTFLTFVAGIVPAGLAAKLRPVEALRND